MSDSIKPLLGLAKLYRGRQLQVVVRANYSSSKRSDAAIKNESATLKVGL